MKLFITIVMIIGGLCYYGSVCLDDWIAEAKAQAHSNAFMHTQQLDAISRGKKIITR